MIRNLIHVALACFCMSILSLPVSAAETTSTGWKIVPNKEVCMVTDAHFTRPQIPVERDGKTYYGCCQNCKATIEKDPSARVATDPVSQKPVDKATATIAADNTGAVLYFENKANFEKYVKTNGKKK